MPFIDCRVSVKLTEENKEKLKAGFGRAATCLHKTESYLMVGLPTDTTCISAGKSRKKGRMFPSVCSAALLPPIMNA